ncbi:MAG: pantoate--beta-alanine ligase [Dehalococcoidales bacterium]|nr:pantoate--beta-alanine ligase [Dehalococcoidales bacterium]
MQVVETIVEMRRARKNLAEPVGFVATMGFFHEGHLSLVRKARAENPSVVVSIFVNPAQFSPTEDFKTYPRDLPRDLSLLEKENVDAVFMPPVAEMYPAGFNSWVDIEKVTDRLEGASRPGHFRGVATVVNKLFNIIQPDVAYFGQKDAQQALVVKKMVQELNMGLKIVALPTVRDPDGLAISSRNACLNSDERKAAPVLYRALCLARELWSGGEKDAGRIRKQMRELIQKEPLAVIDYVSIADPETLEEMDTVRTPALMSLAVKIGKTRLIDNVVVG